MSNPSVGGTETFLLGIIPHLRLRGCQNQLVNFCKNSVISSLASCHDVGYEEFCDKDKIFHPATLWRFLQYVRRNKPDIILGFGFRVSMFLRALKLFYPHVPVIIGLRGLDSWKKKHHGFLERITQIGIDLFVANSCTVAELRKKREKTPPHKIVVIPNGIDVEFFHPEVPSDVQDIQKQFPQDELLFLTVANFRYQKGYDFLLDAIVKVKHRLTNVHFIWIGVGPLKSHLEERIHKENLNYLISFEGYCRDVRNYLKAADAFILPSSEESMPRALMEAMAMELPCISTNVGGVPEVIEGGENGLLVDFGDTLDMADKIMTLAGSGELRNKLATNGRERIVKEFSIETISKAYIKLFELIKSGGRNGLEIQCELNGCN